MKHCVIQLKPSDLDTSSRPWATIVNIVINGALEQVLHVNYINECGM